MKRIAFHNLGCKVNSYELDIMRQKTEEAGYISVPFEDEADVYVINTCTVTNIADRKSRQMIHKAKKRSETTTRAGSPSFLTTSSQSAPRSQARPAVADHSPGLRSAKPRPRDHSPGL